MIKGKYFFTIISICLVANLYCEDLKVKITPNISKVDVDVMGEVVTIKRIQDTNHKLKNSYAKTSRPCPPFCVQPFEPIKGIKTIGEIELLKFLENDVNNNTGVLVDARLPKWYKEGTIPGAINIPFPILNPRSQYIDKVLPLLGAKKVNGKWDFTNAQKLVIFDNGPWSQQGTRAMEHLVELGYPKDKIYYYRGGMQYWQILGLTVLHPKGQ